MRSRLPTSERLVMQDYPILYVDDEEPNLDVFEAVFGDDFVVHVASSGEEALAVLDEERIAVVVADNRMPNMSGIQLFGIIGERFPTVKRVLCTAYSDQRTAIEAINVAGVQHYLVKPWDAKEVEKLLRGLIADAHLAQSAEAMKSNLIERERNAALAEMRTRITHELGNVVSVLRAVDLDLHQTLEDAAPGIAPELLRDLREQASIVGQTGRSLARLHRDAREAHAGGGGLEAKEHGAVALVDGVARMVWHELLGAARLSFSAEPDLFFWADAVGVTRILVAAIGWAARRVESQHAQPPVIRLAAAAEDAHVHFDVIHPVAEDVSRLRALLEDGLEAMMSGEEQQFVLTLAVARDLAKAMSGELTVSAVDGATRLRLTVPRAV